MATIVTRTGKGSALTFAEGDANFTNLNTDKIELTDISVTTATSAETSALSYNNATGVFTFTPVEVADLAALDDFSVTTATAAETSALSYNGATGVFTFTPVETTDLIGLTDLSVTQNTASGAGALSYNNTTGVISYTPPTASGLGAMENLSDDTTPQLAGSLDTNGNDITSNGNLDVNIAPAGTGSTVVNKINYTSEKMGANFSASGTLTPDVTDGNLQYLALSGNITINDMTSPETGVTITLLLDGTAGSYTGTFGSKLLFAGGAKTLTDGGLDVLTMTCVDDTSGDEVYACSLATNFS